LQELIELDLFHNALARFSTEDFEAAGLNADDRFLIEHMADHGTPACSISVLIAGWSSGAAG
jgi:hypothetical protein